MRVSKKRSLAVFGIATLTAFIGSFAVASVASARATNAYELGDAFYRDLHKRDFNLLQEPNEVDSFQKYRDDLYTRYANRALSQVSSITADFMRGLFGQGFRLQSQVIWERTRGLQTDFAMGVPLLPYAVGKDKVALQLQAGLTQWEGVRQQERLDLSLGISARYKAQAGSPFAFGAPAILYGINAFYDVNEQTGLARFGAGFDIQSQNLQLRLNAYLAAEQDWQNTNYGYQERALSGLEFIADYDITPSLRLQANVSTWENFATTTGADLGMKWESTIGAAWQMNPYLSLQSSYVFDETKTTQHDYILGLQAKFPPRPLARSPQKQLDLYNLIDRESRIDYQERVAPVPRPPPRTHRIHSGTTIYHRAFSIGVCAQYSPNNYHANRGWGRQARAMLLNLVRR